MLSAISENPQGLVAESPTGSGKTAVEYTVLAAARSQGPGPFFFIVPNKTLVEQISREFPDLRVALGRNEHPCLYYDEKLPADK
ncbi:MAG TPA: DEAD/DEAH box helicase family protein, partial [Nitrososphaera sp.]|nr:DEAD/DEAH box helicase family protein [Nitrososphaera sp.]